MRLNLQYINKKKILLISGLIGLSVILAIYTELYAKPTLTSDKSTLNRVTSEFNETKNNNLNIEDELTFTREHKEEFEVLKNAGFMERQERDIVQVAVDEAMRLSGIIGGSFRVSPPSCYVNADLKDSDYVILGSPVIIDTDSFEDISMYRFYDYFVRKIPGYVVLEDFTILRTTDVTRSVLQEIGTGQKLPLIKAKISLTWYTIVKKDSIECSGLRKR